MPRQPININNFFQGVVSKVDSNDINPEACPYCKNINPLFTEGRLQGIKQKTTLAGYPAYAAKISAFIDKDDSTKTLLYHDGTTLRAIEDFHTAKTNYGSPTAMNGYAITPYNNFANIGNGNTAPKWAGYITRQQFDGLITRVGTGVNDLTVDISEKTNTTAKTVRVKIVTVTDLRETGLAWSDNGGYIQIGPTPAPHALVVGQVIRIEASYTYDYYDEGTGDIYSVAGTTAGLTTVKSDDAADYFTVDWAIPDVPNLTPDATGASYFTDGGTRSNTFRYWDTADAEPATETTITAQTKFTISYGVVIKFAQALGHIANDYWDITLKASAVNTFTILDSELNSHAADSTIAIGTIFQNEGTAFIRSRKYYYGWTFSYDNAQESPIAWNGSSVKTIQGDFAETVVTVTITTANINARVTGLNIYRADSSLLALEPESQFRLIKVLSINDSWVYANATTNTRTFSDVGDLGASYEAINGVPQTLTKTIVNYHYSTIANNKLFMAKCYTDYWDDSLRLIFASKPNQFNTVDVTADVVRVKFIPTGITNYNGKILVFGENEYAIINPEGMYIELETPGIGCYSHKAITTTDWGVYWCDAKGAYYYNGASIEILSDAIVDKVDTTIKSWADIVGGTGIELQVLYYHPLRSILFINNYTGVIWCYYLPNKAWFYWEIGATGSTQSSLFVDKDSVLWQSQNPGAGAAWYTMFTSSSYFAWEWYSKKLHLGQPSQIKKWYKILTDGSTTNVTTTYGIEDAVPTSALTDSEIAVADRRAKVLQVKVTCPISTLNYVNSITILARAMVGLR